MTVTVAGFRADFPEFSDATVAYPDAVVNFWLSVGGLLLNTDRWGNLLDFGLELFVAHNLALERKAQITAAKGGVPGVTEGMLASKSVDKVSIGYSSAGMDIRAGHWQLTTFGLRFIQLARQIGSGGMQTGPGGAIGYTVGTFNGFW